PDPLADHRPPPLPHDGLHHRLCRRAARGVERQENLADPVLAGRRQRKAEPACLADEKFVRNLHQHPGAVARSRVASAGSAMGQVVEHLEPLLQDVVRAYALGVDQEADPAGVVLVRWIVEALARGDAARLMHRYVLLDSPEPFLAAPWRWRRPSPGSPGSSATVICVRSVCVDSTTIVSVR